MNIVELNKRLKPIMLNICGDRFNTNKCLWQMNLSDDECIELMCLLDDEFGTDFIDMDLKYVSSYGIL